MSKIKNLIDKIKAHFKYAKMIYTVPIKEFSPIGAAVSCTVGSVVFVPWMIFVCGKESLLAFGPQGKETLNQRFERNEVDCVLSEKEENVFQNLNLVPTIAGMVTDTMLLMPVFLSGTLVDAFKHLTHKQQNKPTWDDHICKDKHSVAETSKRILTFCFKGPSGIPHNHGYHAVKSEQEKQKEVKASEQKEQKKQNGMAPAVSNQHEEATLRPRF